MGQIFTDDIKNRKAKDEKMMAEGRKMLDSAINRNVFTDDISTIHSNEAALEMLLDYCGIDESMLKHLDEEDVLFSRIETEKCWYKNQCGYYLGIDKEGRRIAIMPNTVNRYFYFDEKGKKRIVRKSNSKNFVAVYALCRLLPEKKLGLWNFLTYCLSYIRTGTIIGYIVLSVIAGLIGLIFPQTVTKLMEIISGGTNVVVNKIITIALIGLGAELLKTLLHMILVSQYANYAISVAYNVRNAALIRYINDYRNEANKAPSATVWKAIQTYVPDFVMTLLKSGFCVMPELIFSVCYCLAFLVLLREIAKPFFIALLVYVILICFINFRYNTWYKRTCQVSVKCHGILYQAFKGIEKIRSRAAEKRIFLIWGREYADGIYYDKYRKRYQSMSIGVQDIIVPVLTVVLIFSAIAMSLVSKGPEKAEVLAGIMLAGLLAGQLADVATYFVNMFNSGSVWANISFLFEGGKAVEKKTPVKEFVPVLSVNKVSYAYPGMNRLLDNLSFQVAEGEYVGIVGMSGCGKSTLLKLILGNLTADTGEIRYGEYDINRTEIRSLMKHIGTVMQSETLIPGTIRTNMMMQPKPVTEEEIWETLEKVKIADAIRKMPEGIDTPIQVNGSGMSGGQMQKILIARAIVSKPQMLIIDEATSALDNISQKEVKEVLDSMNCTRIVVAHRLSTVKDCDRIIVLDQGEIVQTGTYEELMEQEGLFRELVKTQTA